VTGSQSLRNRFVEYIPEDIEEGVLYISIRFGTAVHQCCCGCGAEVVTPLSPTDWAITYDGESVSLDPSIGNWDAGCHSHYWIRRGMVIWARPWSSAQIEAGRKRDAIAKRRHVSAESVSRTDQADVGRRGAPSGLRGWLARVLRR
jgi:hypothetical protein